MSSVIEGGRLLSVQSERRDASDILVTVEDSGIGIDPAYADRMFDAYFTTKYGATGLGLSLCRSFVEAHGGQFWASPRVPHGAAFFVQLPVNT